MYKQVSDLGVYCTVVGGAITRPKQITERFIKAIAEDFYIYFKIECHWRCFKYENFKSWRPANS